MKVFFIVIIVLMSAIYAFNVQLDVAGFRSGEIFPLAAAQQSGQTLVSDRDYDQRSWVQARLKASCPNTLILSSSTLGTITGPMLATPSFLNAWLTGPSVEDLEAMTQMLHSMNCRPARIIVGIDPFFVNPKVMSNRWRTVKQFQRKYTQHDQIDSQSGSRSSSQSSSHVASLSEAWAELSNHWLKFTDRLAYQTTRDGVRLVLAGEQHSIGPRLLSDLTDFCAKTLHPQSIRHLDGHFSYCANWLKTVTNIEEIARTYVQRDVHSVRSWRRISVTRMDRMKAALLRLQLRGSQLVLVTPTYHPLTYAALRADKRIAGLLDGLDAGLRTLATQHSFLFVPLRDPSLAGCATDQFLDSHHPAPACAKRIAEYLKTRLKP